MRRRLLVLAGVAVVAWAAVAVVWLVLLAGDLRAGRDAASVARSRLGAEDVADRAPLGSLREAADRFEAAHDRADGLVLMPLRVVPFVGRQLRSVRALSGAAAEVAAAGADAVDRAAHVLADPAASGRARLDQLRALAAIVDDVGARIAAVDDLGPRGGLLGPLAEARDDVADDLDDANRRLATARVGARAALSLVEGPRRYLLIAANNAEMRAGSGMWLQGGLLTTGDGALEVGQLRPLYLDAEPPPGAVEPDGDLAARWGFLQPGDDYRNLMASPRFEPSARLAVAMWTAAGGEPVDGVLVVDAVGLQAIVAATGPVTANGRTLAGGDIPEFILNGQYELAEDYSDNTERRNELAAVTSAAVRAVDAGDWSVSTMLRQLAAAVEGRHLLAWSTVEIEQRGWDAAGMSGALTEESLLVSVLNRGANKLDWFLEVDAELAVVAARGGGWDVTATITLHNTTPSDEPRYVQGPLPSLDLDAGEYRGILAVNVPGAAQEARFDGVERLAVAGADGPTRVVGYQLDLPRGERHAAVLRFHLPEASRRVVVEPSARVPAIRWRHDAMGWQDTTPTVAKW